MSEVVAQVKPKDVSQVKPSEAKPKAEQSKSSSKSSITISSILGLNTTAVKKFFKIDKEYLLVAVLFFILLIGAYGNALTISAPEKISVTDKATFYVKLTNDSASAVNVNVNFYSPVKSEVFAPKKVLLNSTSESKIIVYNSNNLNEDVEATVEAMVGEEAERSVVILSFQSKNITGLESAVGAFFSIGTFNEELAKLSPIEWIVFWILVIVAAVLLVAFIARVNRRV